MRRAVVLGGGVAGLTAAIGLRRRGFAVALCEARSWLGGRAFSSPERAGGRLLDNGPHVMMGCYRAMRALLRELGTESCFRQARSLQLGYAAVGGAEATLRLSRLPVPLAMPAALLGLPLGLGGRWAALRGMLASLRRPPGDWTLARWLAAKRQNGAAADHLWLPLCRAVMNAEPDEVAAAPFLATLREAFGGGASAAAIWLPEQPWGQLVGAAAERRLPELGIELCLHHRVEAIETGPEGRALRVRFPDRPAREIDADTLLVSAMPWHALARLVPVAAAAPSAALRGSPIHTVYFEAEAGAPVPAPREPLVALVAGDPFHFYYRTPGAPATQFALLAGGNRRLDGIGVGEIERLAREQVARHFPAVPVAFAARACVRKEASATFVVAPGGPPRPAPGPLPGGPPNLWVCGDWTDSGLPATLEGAARSAQAMLAALG